MLGRVSRDPVELRLRHLQLTIFEGLQRLHGSFTKGLGADNQSALVVLDSARKNF